MNRLAVEVSISYIQTQMTTVTDTMESETTRAGLCGQGFVSSWADLILRNSSCQFSGR